MSLGLELLEIERAIAAAERLLQADPLGDGDGGELTIRESAAILALVRSRMSLVGKVVRGSIDPKVAIAEHNRCPAASADWEDPDIRLRPWGRPGPIPANRRRRGAPP